MKHITNPPVGQLGNPKFKKPLYDNLNSILKKQLKTANGFVTKTWR